MTSSDILTGLGLIVGIAVGCQILASRLRLPAIILLLPAGFLAGALTSNVDPNAIFGDAFGPLVALAVAIILFHGSLDLRLSLLESSHYRVVRRLIFLGVPLTWLGAGVLVGLLLGLPVSMAVMLGAILIVSGPTVVGPLLAFARPNRAVRGILNWEGITIDPIGALIAAIVFSSLTDPDGIHLTHRVVELFASVGVGVVGAAVGTLVLVLLLDKLALRGMLAAQAMVGTVVFVAAMCDFVLDDTGLIAAVIMGVALGNMAGDRLPQEQPFLSTTVQFVIGILFVSISATVTPESLRSLLLPIVGVIAGLVLVVRPLVAYVATLGSRLSLRERAFIGWMDPRGIVAASTAATFAAPLMARGLDGADKLLPATFLVIVGTVAIYGLTAVPVARWLKVTADDDVPADDVAGRPDD